MGWFSLLHRMLVRIDMCFEKSIPFSSTSQGLTSARSHVAVRLERADAKNCNRADVANVASKVCSVLTGESLNSLLVTLKKD
jgi:hypothetical protein